MKAWALVVAAGSGSRFGAAKQFADLGGRPVLEWSLEMARSACAGTVLVLPADRMNDSARWAVDATGRGRVHPIGFGSCRSRGAAR